MVLVAIVNGLIRQEVFIPIVGDLGGHQLSTVTFIALLFGYLWLAGRRWPIPSSGQAWQIGTLWLGMTVLFEFGFGHYVMGHSWEKLLHDYNVLEGRLWVVVLAAVWAGPVLLQRRGGGSEKQEAGSEKRSER